jgi:hypothetical protein
VIGACQETNDVVDLTLDVTVEADLGLYVNTVGRNGAYKSKCMWHKFVREPMLLLLAHMLSTSCSRNLNRGKQMYRLRLDQH